MKRSKEFWRVMTAAGVFGMLGVDALYAIPVLGLDILLGIVLFLIMTLPTMIVAAYADLEC